MSYLPILLTVGWRQSWRYNESCGAERIGLDTALPYDSMTPAIEFAKKNNLVFKVYEYEHDESGVAYGLEVAEKLGLPKQRVFKTLVVDLDRQSLAVAIVPVADMLSMKLIARVAGVKRAEMASTADVERSTGYVLGGISPLGQKKRLPTYIDESARKFDTIYVSAGRRGLEIELSPVDLCATLHGQFATITQKT